MFHHAVITNSLASSVRCSPLHYTKGQLLTSWFATVPQSPDRVMCVLSSAHLGAQPVVCGRPGWRRGCGNSHQPPHCVVPVAVYRVSRLALTLLWTLYVLMACATSLSRPCAMSQHHHLPSWSCDAAEDEYPRQRVDALLFLTCRLVQMWKVLVAQMTGDC